MAEQITGSCNCGRHTFTIPKPTEMNLCRMLECSTDLHPNPHPCPSHHGHNTVTLTIGYGSSIANSSFRALMSLPDPSQTNPHASSKVPSNQSDIPLSLTCLNPNESMNSLKLPHTNRSNSRLHRLSKMGRRNVRVSYPHTVPH